MYLDLFGSHKNKPMEPPQKRKLLGRFLVWVYRQKGAGHTTEEVRRVKKPTKYIITGLLAGVTNGLFGAGGGLFLVPLFVGWVGLEQRKAFATSVAVVLPLCVAALVSYAQKGGVDLALALPYLAGGLVGGVLAGRVFDKIPVLWLRRGFGALLVYGGVKAVLLL